MRTAEHSARELGSRTARQRLPVQARPYFTHVQDALSLGYRRGKRGGSWIARSYDQEHGYRFGPLGKANDLLEDIGLSFQQAQDEARRWFASLCTADIAGVKLGPYRVKDAARDWLDKWKGSERGKATAEANVKYHILPTLGHIEVRKLSTDRIEKWLDELAKAPPIKVQRRLTPTKKLPPSRQSKIIYDPNDPETKRRRKDTANRVLTDLLSLLNSAFKRRKVESKAGWETVTKLENASIAKNEYLRADEAMRFIECSPSDFRDLVHAALITGCRYGELCNVQVSAYDPTTKTISILKNKTRRNTERKLKHIYLSDEDAAFFDGLTEGKERNAWMLLRSSGEQWNKSNQQQRMKEVLKNAKIQRHIRFHDLRHTFASLLVQSGASIEVIANQLGHSGTAMANKHYAHLSPEYLGNTVRAHKPSFGFVSKPKPQSPTLVSKQARAS